MLPALAIHGRRREARRWRLGQRSRGVTDTGRGGKRKPVTGGARSGDTDMGGDADGERSEAYGMSWAMPPEGGESVEDDARGSALAAAVAQTLERDAMVKGRAGPKAGGRPTSPSGVG